MSKSRRRKIMNSARRRQNILEIVAKLAKGMYSKRGVAVASGAVNQTRAKSESECDRMRTASG